MLITFSCRLVVQLEKVQKLRNEWEGNQYDNHHANKKVKPSGDNKDKGSDSTLQKINKNVLNFKKKKERGRG